MSVTCLSFERLARSAIGAGFAIGLLACPSVSQAEIIGYRETSGVYNSAWTSSGDLVNGPFDGMNISQIPASRFIGVENTTMHILDDEGYTHLYFIGSGGGNSAFYLSGQSPVLTEAGPLLGQPLKNPNFLGATDNVFYYVDGTGGVVSYRDWINHDLMSNPAWTTFTNGPLDGQPVQVGMGLLDYGGGNALTDGYFVWVNEADGTMDYYYLPTGNYTPGLEATYGSWTTFDGGELDGLTLLQLRDNPSGTHNGISYRFLGISDDSMYFDIQPVPEPSTALLAGLAGVAPLLSRGRARKNQKAA